MTRSREIGEDHAIELEELRPRWSEQVAVWSAAALLLAFLAWSSVTVVPEVAVAPGEVMPALAAAPLQHLEGGIVAAVLIHEGDAVAAGQPLLRLVEAAVRAELGQLEARREGLDAQARRLQALVDADPEALASGQAAGILATQRAALISRLQLIGDRRSIAIEQTAQRDSEMAMLKGQIANLDLQVAMYAIELEVRQELWRGGLATRATLLEAQRLLLSTQTERNRLAGQRDTTARALAEAQARLIEGVSAAQDDARQEAARVAVERAEIEESIARVSERADRMLVRAPIGGVVRGLAAHRPGTVLQPGALIAEIMPQDVALVVDARLLPRDAGFVALGQAVSVKVQAFDHARYGVVPGRVERVSAGTFLDEQRQPYYRARIALEQDHVGAVADRNRLVPGMTVQADIIAGRKTVLQYLLRPLHVAASTALRER